MERRDPDPTVAGDPGISTLGEVLDPVTARTYLGQALSDHVRAIEDIRFDILKHHPGKRCTLNISVRTPDGWRALIGKVYAEDRPDVYGAMRELTRAGFGPEEAMGIPQPIAYVPALRLLLQENIDGPRAKEIFLTGDERDRAEASARSARWLAKFHAIAPRSGAVLDPLDELEAAERWSRTIAGLAGPFPGQARTLFRRLEEEAPSASASERCAGHGSYNCNQIILTKDRTITFDWDGHDVADPGRDVARFIVALERLAFKYLGSIRALDAAADVFLRTYQALSPFEVSANLSWYRALTCLRLAKYEAHRPVCTLRAGIEALLGEGVRVLER
jgi:hypothetical protein